MNCFVFVDLEINLHSLNMFISSEKLTYFVEVERKFARYRAVQPRFQISRPVLRQDIFTAGVSFADSRHAGVHALPAIYVFHRRLAEEEEYVAADVVRSHEIRF